MDPLKKCEKSILIPNNDQFAHTYFPTMKMMEENDWH